MLTHNNSKLFSSEFLVHIRLKKNTNPSKTTSLFNYKANPVEVKTNVCVCMRACVRVSLLPATTNLFKSKKANVANSSWFSITSDMSPKTSNNDGRMASVCVCVCSGDGLWETLWMVSNQRLNNSSTPQQSKQHKP